MGKLHSDYRFAVISAAPNPEYGERVHVALVFGNGRPFRLEYPERLPRLKGLVASDALGVWRLMLEGLRASLEAGLDWDQLRPVLGPQFLVEPPQPLYGTLDESTIRLLATSLLDRPRVPYQTEIDNMERRAEEELAQRMRDTRPPGVTIVKRATVERLYQSRLNRFVSYRIPPAKRVARGDTRDVVFDSVIVDPRSPEGIVNVGVMRASRVFHAFHRLAPVIQRNIGREVRRVGVILPPRVPDTADTIAARDWIKSIWSVDAQVIVGDEASVDEQVRECLAWAVDDRSD